jgi:hypothetical protein
MAMAYGWGGKREITTFCKSETDKELSKHSKNLQTNILKDNKNMA